MYTTIVQKLKNIFIGKKPKLKDTLNVVQNGDIIEIEGFLSNPNYDIKKLCLKLRGEDQFISVENEQTGSTFKFQFDLKDHENLLQIDDEICDFYLLVHVCERELTEQQKTRLKGKARIFEDEDNILYEYRLRLGRFNTTTCHFEKKDLTYHLYTTVKGNISLAINKEIEQKVITQIDYLHSKNDNVSLGGRLFTRSHEIKDLSFILLGREANAEIALHTDYDLLTEDTKKRYGLNRYEYQVTFNINDLLQSYDLHDGVYDLFFDMTFADGEVRRVRLGRPRFKARRNLKSSNGTKGNYVYTFSPYYTFRHSNLSFQVDKFEQDIYEYMVKTMRRSFFVRLLNKRKNIWLIGERIDKAQDTGYHLFKYIRKNYPNFNAYYVIDKDSPELKNVEPLGNVLYYKSKEHIEKTIAATRIIGSHHPDYLYPLRSDTFKKKVKGGKVFLQHGIMGTKNMIANYGKKTSGFETDLFLVSSHREKEIIVNDFEYKREDVAVTGLSRFDSLFEADVEVKRQLLIIPTWREWLIREDLFLESEYFERYRALIHSEQLHELAKTYNFEIVFCLHTNMQKYTSYFQDAPVRVISQGEVDVQHLLKESAMMITDYSSVAFDFSFLKKPILYYQFDRRRFFGPRGSHIDIENDLPGDIVFTEEDIINSVETYARENFVMKEENALKADSFLTYKDQHSSERVFNAIKDNVRRKPAYERVMETELYRTIFNRYRRSKWYRPSMRVVYNILKTVLPVDDKLIVFESGIGKQYADSPKYIYEEIVRRNLDYKKVWVCNKIVRLNDENTIRIKRFSPRYYYYLARAKVWVNNQNFPARLEKRRETTYVQTWHGTPLKKMLFDIDNVMGRSIGYVERISSAVLMWDYLLSPSEYATERFKSAFRYKGEILETGYPRNDIFYRKDKHELKEKVRNKLMLPADKKVILYAPTFRDNQTTRSNRFVFDIKMDLNKMQESLGDDYIVLLRMHVAVTNKVKIDEELEDFVYNVSSYSDMQELLLITDILVTDYSSVMFDFANTKRPMLFFTYDLKVYRDEVRGFYMDFEKEAPGPLVKTTEEIVSNIQNLDTLEENYKEKYEKFYEKYCKKEDGEAAKRVVDLLFDSKNNDLSS